LDAKGYVRPSKLVEAARKLEKDAALNCCMQQPRRYPIALKSHPSELLLDFLPYYWDMGGDFVREELLDSVQFKTMLQHACDMYCEIMCYAPPDTKSYGNSEIAQALSDGRVAMAVSWGGQAAPIVKAGRNNGIEFSITPLATSWNATWGIGIISAIDSARAAQVLCMLLELMDKHLDRLVAEYAGSPVRISTYASAEINEKCPWLKAQLEMIQNARHLPSDSSLVESVNKIGERIAKAVHGAEE
jgi:ABC-type sugar transport system, periplasmic component